MSRSAFKSVMLPKTNCRCACMGSKDSMPFLFYLVSISVIHVSCRQQGSSMIELPNFIHGHLMTLCLS